MILSASRIRCYKECRRKYFISYVKGLVPVETSAALEIGSAFHDHLERIIVESGKAKIEPYDVPSAMAQVWQDRVYPKFKFDAQAVEKPFEYQIGKHTIIGHYDALTEKGTPIEHKTTSLSTIEFMNRLFLDEQAKMYCLAAGKDVILYDIMKKPTIRQKKDETETEFAERCMRWYDENPDAIETHQAAFTQRELFDHEQMIRKLADEMEQCDFFYRNPSACSFWSCPFEAICGLKDSELTESNLVNYKTKEVQK